MRRAVFALTILFAIAAAGSASAKLSDDPVDVTAGVTIADVRAIVADAGGVVRSIDATGERGFKVEVDMPDNIPLEFEGLTCKGDGEARRCTEYMISMTFGVDSAARAQELELPLQYRFIAARAVGDQLIFSRMDFTYGGVTRGHVAAAMQVMREMALGPITRTIWPENKKPG
jgi:hypothetical protein